MAGDETGRALFGPASPDLIILSTILESMLQR
jgi:hypothetical protein